MALNIRSVTTWMTLGSKGLECESDEVTDEESGDDEKDEG